MDYLSEWLAFLLTLALATSPQTLKSTTRSTSPYISLGVTSIQFDPVSGELVPQIITDLKQDLQLKPSSYGYVTLGFYLIESAKLAEATLAFRKALALPIDVEHSDNIHAIAYEGLGLSLMLQGNFKEAVAAYRGAIALNSSNARTYIGLGFALQKTKQLAASLEAFHQGLQIADSELSDDLKARGLYGLGQVFEQQGNLDEAIRYYREAIRTEPDHLEAWKSLSQVQQRLLQQYPSTGR